MSIFSKKGNVIFGLVTRWYAIGYAIKVLIINAETRFRDFLHIWKGWHEKNQKKIYRGGIGNGGKAENRVPMFFLVVGIFGKYFCKPFGIFAGVFGRFLARSFCGVFGGFLSLGVFVGFLLVC